MTGVAASLSPADRQHLAVKMLAQTEPVVRIARDNEVSRPFLYRQKAMQNWPDLKHALIFDSRRANAFNKLALAHQK